MKIPLITIDEIRKRTTAVLSKLAVREQEFKTPNQFYGIALLNRSGKIEGSISTNSVKYVTDSNIFGIEVRHSLPFEENKSRFGYVNFGFFLLGGKGNKIHGQQIHEISYLTKKDKSTTREILLGESNESSGRATFVNFDSFRHCLAHASDFAATVIRTMENPS